MSSMNTDALRALEELCNMAGTTFQGSPHLIRQHKKTVLDELAKAGRYDEMREALARLYWEAIS